MVNEKEDLKQGKQLKSRINRLQEIKQYLKRKRAAASQGKVGSKINANDDLSRS